MIPSALVILTTASLCIAQPTAPADSPMNAAQEVMPAIVDRANAAYLSEDERADFAIEHGLWNDDHLSDPGRLARAALIAGAYEHPALMSQDAQPLDRAISALMRGQPEDGLRLLDEPIADSQLARLTIRARCMTMLGRTGDAIEELEGLESILESSTINNATELGYGVRGLMHLYSIRAMQADAGTVYKQLNTLIAHGRDTIDQLNPEIRMVEAELLYEHHNAQAARDAAIEVLKRNPKHALAFSLLGRIAVDQFDLDQADRIANQLDTIAGSIAGAQSPSILSAQIRARAALRHRDPIGAEHAIDPVLARVPNQRDLLALEAAASAGAFRESSTERLLAAYNELSPDQPDALMLVGTTLAEARQYEQGEEMLHRAIALAPHWGTPRLELGLMLIQSGDDTGAKKTLERAIKLDPFNLRAQNSLTLVRELMGFETIETEHFVLRFQSGIDRVLAEEMPPTLEEIYRRVTGGLPGGTDHEPGTKTRIEIMPNHEFFSVRITGMPSIHTMAASTGPIIAMESPRDTNGSFAGSYDWARVFQHEFTHSANLSRTRNRIIHWMTEANAVYNEDAPRSSRTWSMLTSAFTANRLFDLEEINEAFVRPKREGDRSLAYAQGAWMYEFIIERFGPDAPLKIMDASTAGRTPTEAFVESLGVSPDEFYQDFLVWGEAQLIELSLVFEEGSAHLPLSELLPDAPSNPSRIPAETINTLLIDHPEHPQLLRVKFAQLLSTGKARLDGSTIESIQRFIRISPTDEVPHRLLARHYLASDDADTRGAALEHLIFLDDREVHSSAYADQIALLAAQRSDLNTARRYAQLAVRRSPFNPHYREQGARIAILTGDYELAARHIEALIKLEPDQPIHAQRLEALNALRSMPTD